ncbi:hypothetical protein [Cohnella phaseoli]|uniref:Uncharacterized protein n=1 Tax=Cohnella phaseoli TaxID=456490 RepID=A0A3D9KCM3_9BACL|nr:hypothetical protein [Cohnella phaseoli]RED84043.1 hypothetical protein DFP98_107151 [Cohnella phaseoli]
MQTEMNLKKIIKYTSMNKKLLIIIMFVSIVTSTLLNVLFMKTSYTSNQNIQISPIIELEKFEARYNLAYKNVINNKQTYSKMIEQLQLDPKVYTFSKMKTISTISADFKSNSVEIEVSDPNKALSENIAMLLSQEFARAWTNGILKSEKIVYEEKMNATKDSLDAAKIKINMNSETLKKTPQTIELANSILMDGKIGDGEEINPIYVQLMNKQSQLEEEAALIELVLKQEEGKFNELVSSLEGQLNSELLKINDGQAIQISYNKEFLEVQPLESEIQTSISSRIGFVVGVSIVCLISTLLAIILKEYLKDESK